jgi:V8-like Glu-specific endopeptidase
MTTGAPASSSFPAGPGIQLSADDFDQLAVILAAVPEFRTVQGRLDFLDDVFAGSPRRADVLSLLNLDGAPRGVAVRVIARLTQFGQDEPGRETLGVLINKLLTYIGGGAEADFLRDLFARYPLHAEPAAAREIDDWRGRESPEDVQEKIIGENTLRDVCLLELALEASPAVVHIATATQLGSGFLAGAGLVMTNHHVIHTLQEARDSLFTFNYQLDRAGNPAPVRTVGVAVDGLFYTNPALDFTVVEIDAVPEGVAPLRLGRLRVQRDDRVNIIQHPGGHYKKISMTNNFVAFANARDLQYLTSTLPGSSGSPVFNNDFLVVGIHHSGGNLLEPGTEGKWFRRRYLRNAGSSMAAVLDDLQANAPAIYERLHIE